MEEKRVEVFIPRGADREDPNLFVGINGVNYLLPRGNKSMVPAALAAAMIAETAMRRVLGLMLCMVFRIPPFFIVPVGNEKMEQGKKTDPGPTHFFLRLPARQGVETCRFQHCIPYRLPCKGSCHAAKRHD